MDPGWLIIRKHKALNDKFLVCLEREDALRIAKDMVKYWRAQYNWIDYNDYLDERLDGHYIFKHLLTEEFSVTVEPVDIREPGDLEP